MTMHGIFSNLTKTNKTLLIIAGFTFFAVLTLLLRNVAMESHYQRAKLFNTAVHAQTPDSFNYAVDTQQGNIITHGIFKTKDPVSRPEVKGEYFRITKVEQEYTRHETEYECGTEDSPQTCTTVYYSWDYNGEESNKAAWVNFHERNYASELFAINYTRELDCVDFIVECKSGGYQYENDSWWGSSEGDIRWYYTVTDTVFDGTIFVNTYDGAFKPVEHNIIHVRPQSVGALIAEANDSSSITFFIIMALILNLIICGILFKENVIEEN